MDFSYTPRLEELKARAAALTQRLMAYEDECERDGSLTPARLAEIRDAVLEAGLNAINMPAEWGGAGLTVLEQVVVQEELGKLTNAIWTASGARRTRCATARPSSGSAGWNRASAASAATPSRSRRRRPAPIPAASPPPRRATATATATAGGSTA